MDEQLLHQIFDELLASLEPLETQNAALLQFLKAKGLATDQDLAPFLEQAANTANVRWRAVRVRTNALLTSALKPKETPVESNKSKDEERNTAEAGSEKSDKKTGEKQESQSKTNDPAPLETGKAEEGNSPQPERTKAQSQSEASQKPGQAGEAQPASGKEEETPLSSPQAHPSAERPESENTKKDSSKGKQKVA